jgi:hypothetical protein
MAQNELEDIFGRAIALFSLPLLLGLGFAAVVGVLDLIVGFLTRNAATLVVLAALIIGGITALKFLRHQKRRQKGHGASQRLYKQAVRQSTNSRTSKDATTIVADKLTHALGAAPPQEALSVALDLYRQENKAIGPPPQSDDLVSHAMYRDELRARMKAHVPGDEASADSIATAVARFYTDIPHSPECTFGVPAMDLIPDIRETVRSVMSTFCGDEVIERQQFVGLRDVFEANINRVSDEHLPAAARNAGKYLYPTEHPGSPSEIVHDYLAGTPLERLFHQAIPFGFPFDSRFEHTHIVAGSGHGKTQTLQHLILSDLTAPNPPGLVIIDSQGDMLQKLSRLSLFDPDHGPLASKLVVIDPSDVDYPPALNMFDVNLERLGGYKAAAREQILNGVIELYDYIFGSLLGAELTQKQSVIFRYLARLMLTIPGATIHTLIQLMADATPFMRHIEELPPGARMFFETEFPHKSFAETKRQIQRRLWGILENPTFERMLTAPRNRVDMFDALNSGKIVLVNTAKDFLKAERSSFLGRLFIALTLQAVLERAALPEEKRRPAFLYVDEAADYFDDNIDDLLTQARKYKLGVVFSHQYLDQLAPGLRSSIASNTSIKLAGGVSDRDARSLASDMRTTPTFILAQHKEQHATHFACYVRNHTHTALSLSLPFGSLEEHGTMSVAAYQRLMNVNRNRISTVAPAAPHSPPSGEPMVNLHRPDLPWRLEPIPNGRITRIDPNGDVHVEMDLHPEQAGTIQPLKVGTHTLRIDIPGDVEDGETLRAKDRGKATQPGAAPGHLFITVKLRALDIGDFVQWENNGVPQFPTPRRVTNIQGHNGQRFVFVEGSPTGILITEVHRVRDHKPGGEVPPGRPDHAPADVDDWSG